jgi:hypothetical protein
MLMICRDEPAWNQLSLTERQQIYEETRVLSEELTSRGQYLGGFPLHPSSSATSVRVRDGKRLVTDGPFAETREQLGGYMLRCGKDRRRRLSQGSRPGASRDVSGASWRHDAEARSRAHLDSGAERFGTARRPCAKA